MVKSFDWRKDPGNEKGSETRGFRIVGDYL
jgi:hypothetical protein